MTINRLSTPQSLTALALAATLAVGLTACASNTSPTPASTSAGSSVPAATSTPTATDSASVAGVAAVPAPAPVVTGAVLTADQAKNLPDGVAAYKMADGSLVAVAHTDPVPANVVADIQAQAAAAWPNGPVTDYNQQPAQQKAFNAWIASVSRSTGGRTVLVVVEFMKLHPPQPGSVQTVTYPWFVVQNSFNNWSHYTSFAAAAASAQAMAAQFSPAVVITLGK